MNRQLRVIVQVELLGVDAVDDLVDGPDAYAMPTPELAIEDDPVILGEVGGGTDLRALDYGRLRVEFDRVFLAILLILELAAIQ